MVSKLDINYNSGVPIEYHRQNRVTRMELNMLPANVEINWDILQAY